MRDFVRKPRNWFVTAFVLAFLFALIYCFFASARTNLPAYVTEEPTPTPTEKALDIDTAVYTNDVTGFTMEVPAEWTPVVRDGADSYVNQDGAILMFYVSDYDPTMNWITQETVTSDVQAADGVLGGFAKDNSHSYLAVYEIGSVDYFEYNIWDLQNTVRVSWQIPAARYNYYYDIVIGLFDTFQWKQAAPIPDDFYMFYSDYGNFEFGVPLGWQEELVDETYVVTSPSGSTITCSLTSTSEDLSGITQIDYVNAASAGKSNYLLSSYTNTGATLVAEASYTINGVGYNEVREMLASGSFYYEFIFQCEPSNYETDGAAFLQAMNLFRVF